jgi:cytochrome c556
MKRMVLIGIAAVAVGAGLTAAIAQSDPIADRKKIYKSFGAAAREPGLMLRGQVPFDLNKVQAALRTFEDGTKHLPNMFPDNSKTGGDTEALPVIWEQKEKFNGLFAKLQSESAAALTSIKDEATFKAQFPKILQNCGGCHETFRKKV